MQSVQSLQGAAWAVYFGAARQVATPLTWTPPTGFTERQDADSGLSSTAKLAATLADSNAVVTTGTYTYTGTTSGASPQATAWAAFLRAASTSEAYTGSVALAGAGTLTPLRHPETHQHSGTERRRRLGVHCRSASGRRCRVVRVGDAQPVGDVAVHRHPSTVGHGHPSAVRRRLAGVERDPGPVRVGCFDPGRDPPARPAHAPLTGDGTLTLSATVSAGETRALSGSGTLTLTAAPSTSGTRALSGSGTLAFTGAPRPAGVRALAGDGTLTLSGDAAQAASGTLALSGIIVAGLRIGGERISLNRRRRSGSSSSN